MLSNFQGCAGALLQIFLIGQNEFRGMLRDNGLEQLRQRVIAAYHLAPFDVDETRAYVEHRLALAGWLHDPQIDNEAFTAVHRYTAGIPRRVNTLCDRVLLFACLDDAHTVTAEMVAAVWEDIREEHSLRDETDCGQAINASTHRAPSMSLAPRDRTAGAGLAGERLHSLEASLADLTTFVRDELGLLRQLASS